MAEGWAIAILYAGSVALTGVLMIGLRSLEAPIEIVGLGWVVGVVVVGVGSGLITSHYRASHSRRRDDE